MTTEIQEYSATEAALAKLREKYEGIIFDCAKPKEMKDAKTARAKFVKVRTTLEKKRVEIKGPALKHCQQIDSESNRIKTEILELEDSIDQQIKKEENRKSEEKAEEERKTRAILRKYQLKIEAIRRRPLDYITATPDQILEALTKARGLTADEFPADLRDDAFNALEGAIKKLEEMHIAALDAADKSDQLEAAQKALDEAPVAVADPLDITAETIENTQIVTGGMDRDFVKPIKTTQFVPPWIEKSSPFETQPETAVQPTGEVLINAAKAACQYLEADPKSRNHIVTRNLRAALGRVL